MLKGLKRFAAGGLLLREIRAMRIEFARIGDQLVTIAALLEERNAHDYPRKHVSASPQVPAVEVTYVDDQVQAEWMAIDLALTQVMGRLPSEDEVQAEYDRRHPTVEGLPL